MPSSERPIREAGSSPRIGTEGCVTGSPTALLPIRPAMVTFRLTGGRSCSGCCPDTKPIRLTARLILTAVADAEVTSLL